jgi:hypothetical protein
VYIDSKDPYGDIYGSQKILHKSSNHFKATILLQKCIEEGGRGNNVGVASRRAAGAAASGWRRPRAAASGQLPQRGQPGPVASRRPSRARPVASGAIRAWAVGQRMEDGGGGETAQATDSMIFCGTDIFGG